jgi:hypothetical protein
MSAPTSSAVDTRRYLLERVDEAAVVQLYADGFAELPLREKILVFHLYQAALAGRDIYYDQRYPANLEMRDVLEEILTHASGVDAASLAEIQRYTKLFWLNTGPYNNLTARKFVLKITPEAFAAAASSAAASGARFPLRAGETLDGEGGYTVWGKLVPAERSVKEGLLPIGLAHNVPLLRDVAVGEFVRWADVTVPDSEAVEARRDMERRFAPARAIAAQ